MKSLPAFEPYPDFAAAPATVPKASFPEVSSEAEESFLGDLWGRVAGPRIVDRTAHSPRDKRKQTRDLKTVYALVLHQMAFSRGSNPTRYDNVTAHYAILPDGTILQLHPDAALLWASNGFNRGSVAVEFAGNFPNTNGKCWESRKFGCHRLTQEQIEAGRQLIRHLIRTIGLTHVLAHRQSSSTRTNDPGPDIWYHVGQWAVDNLGLKDGGPGFKVSSGNPIPDAWRTWGRSAGPANELFGSRTSTSENLPMNTQLALEAEPFELTDETADESRTDWESEGGDGAKPAYVPVPGREFGGKWRSQRPPGLPATVRGASAPGEAMPWIVQAALEKNLGDTFLKLMTDLARTESNATFALPANTFDARPEAQRPAGKSRITAWGVFQFNRPAWCALNGFGSANCPADLMPWSATPQEEIRKPIQRYAEVFQSVRTAGGSDVDAARGVRLWQRSPAVEFRRYLDAGRASGDFAAAWQQVAASHRAAVDGRLRNAGLLPATAREFETAAGDPEWGETSAYEAFEDQEGTAYVDTASEGAVVRSAIRSGTTNENSLTDLVFFRRHPERNGRLISRSEPDFSRLSQEWLQIRDTLVRPALRGDPQPAPSGPSRPSSPGSGSGRPSGGNLAARILAEARRHLGFTEGPNNENPFSAYFHVPNVAWCAYFVSYCYTKGGYPLAIGSCDAMLDRVRTQGRLLSNASAPNPADIVVFDWTLSDHDPAEHVGLVERVYRSAGGSTKVVTIEGNSSNGVRRNEYALGDSRIVGFGRLIGVGR